MNGNEERRAGKKLYNIENSNFHCLLIATEVIKTAKEEINNVSSSRRREMDGFLKKIVRNFEENTLIGNLA